MSTVESAVRIVPFATYFTFTILICVMYSVSNANKYDYHVRGYNWGTDMSATVKFTPGSNLEGLGLDMKAVPLDYSGVSDAYIAEKCVVYQAGNSTNYINKCKGTQIPMMYETLNSPTGTKWNDFFQVWSFNLVQYIWLSFFCATAFQLMYTNWFGHTFYIGAQTIWAGYGIVMALLWFFNESLEFESSVKDLFYSCFLIFATFLVTVGYKFTSDSPKEVVMTSKAPTNQYHAMQSLALNPLNRKQLTYTPTEAKPLAALPMELNYIQDLLSHFAAEDRVKFLFYLELCITMPVLVLASWGVAERNLPAWVIESYHHRLFMFFALLLFYEQLRHSNAKTLEEPVRSERLLTREDKVVEEDVRKVSNGTSILLLFSVLTLFLVNLIYYWLRAEKSGLHEHFLGYTPVFVITYSTNIFLLLLFVLSVGYSLIPFGGETLGFLKKFVFLSEEFILWAYRLIVAVCLMNSLWWNGNQHIAGWSPILL